MRAKVFWLLMLTVSRITRLRSVKWLPSLRAKEQKISISLTAYSLALRSVSVTRAFDPSPPLRQDCDEILSPSRGDISMGVIAPAGVVSGLSKDGMSCPTSVDNGADSVTAAATARRTGSLFEVCAVLLADPGSSIHAPATIRMAASSQISFG